MQLAAVLFAFVPFCVRYLSAGSGVIWGFSSLLLGLFLAVQAALVMHRARAMGPGRHEVRPWLTAFMAVCALSALALRAANVAGIGFEREFAPYLIGLVLLLVASAAQFSRLLFLGITGSDS